MVNLLKSVRIGTEFIEEFLLQGDRVVYVNGNKVNLSFSQALQQAEAAEEREQKLKGAK